jgi:hypothetical protein
MRISEKKGEAYRNDREALPSFFGSGDRQDLIAAPDSLKGSSNPAEMLLSKYDYANIAEPESSAFRPDFPIPWQIGRFNKIGRSLAAGRLRSASAAMP